MDRKSKKPFIKAFYAQTRAEEVWLHGLRGE